MSEQPDDTPPERGEQSHSEQPPQHEQPQQHPRGQPPQGGTHPPAGRPPAQQGSGIGDIFNREDTKSQIQSGVVIFVAVGVGLGLTTLLGDILDDIPIVGWNTGPTLATIVAVFVAQQQTEALQEIQDNLAYATAAVTAAIGTLVLSLLTWLFAEIADDGGFVSTNPDLGDVFLVWIGAVIATAIAAVIVVAAARKF